MQLLLEAKEQEILVGVLTHAVSELGHEIADTDNFDFRQDLKERKRILQEVLGRLT
ncbi:MAG: hypothetical protein JSU59_08705 [Nitrospirota bacterium]|nr:MAG: hypothetical protein JSU59_08705 [Nitrospirota bacterium]